jgi:hypothetical protein
MTSLDETFVLTETRSRISATPSGAVWTSRNLKKGEKSTCALLTGGAIYVFAPNIHNVPLFPLRSYPR